MNKFAGLLIGIEGIDGSGKTVFSQSLAEQLEKLNHKTILTKEPGGTKFGLQLREILQYHKGHLDSKSEYLLFAADRAQHFSTLVIPNLEAGNIVISDRTGDSSVVYQGYARGLNIQMIEQINNWAMQSIKPDLIIYLKIDSQTAKERIHKRAEDLTRFEIDPEFTNKTIAGFDDLYQNKDYVLTLDGSNPIDVSVKASLAKIKDLLQQKSSR